MFTIILGSHGSLHNVGSFAGQVAATVLHQLHETAHQDDSTFQVKFCVAYTIVSEITSAHNRTRRFTASLGAV